MDRIYYILCMAGLLCFACTTKQEEASDRNFQVNGDTVRVVADSPVMAKIKTDEVKTAPYQASFSVSGVVEAIPNHYAQIASPFSGRITQSFVRLGQKVHKGSPIFEISSPDFFDTGKNYYQAKQEMDLAEKSLKREKDLLANKVGVQKEVEEAEVNYELKRKDYENALAALKVFQINPDEMVLGQPLVVRSPIDGEVVGNNIVIGQYFKDDADPIAVIADLNRVWVAANVKEKDLALISNLKQVDIALVAYPGKTFTGEIYHVSEMLDEETRSVQVLIECDNPERMMKPAMYASVKLTDEATETVLIPTSAIMQREDDAYVMLDKGDNLYVRRSVVIAGIDGNKSIISSGLEAGDKIVTEGAFYFIDAQ